MEKTSANTLSVSFPLSGLIHFFFLHIIRSWIISIQNFISVSRSFLQSNLNVFGISKVVTEKKDLDFELSSRQVCLNQKEAVEYLCREDVEMVMGKLGICCSPEGEKLEERVGSDEICGLFEEKEPSLEEVKEAFDVFDENRDGFIDAGELQRVICILGLRQGLELEECKRMIGVFDENGDGRIDFNEFVKFLVKHECHQGQQIQVW